MEWGPLAIIAKRQAVIIRSSSRRSGDLRPEEGERSGGGIHPITFLISITVRVLYIQAGSGEGEGARKCRYRIL